MRYLITGGAGMIGSHLAEALIARDDQVTILDIGKDNPVPAAMHIIGNVTDPDLVQRIVNKHDAVFHLAAVVGFANVLNNVRKTVTTSTLGSQTVFHHCAMQSKRVLFTSSSAVYGRATDTKTPVEETDDVQLGPTTTASWAYAYAKAAEECLALAYHRERRMSVVIARVFNTVGPRQKAQAGFVFPKFAEAIRRHQPVPVYAPGTQGRTYCHVQDTVRALIALMDHSVDGEVVNVGGVETATTIDLAKRMIALSGTNVTVKFIEPPYSGYDNVLHRRPCLDKLRRLTGVVPQFGLDRMIQDVLAEHAAAVV